MSKYIPPYNSKITGKEKKIVIVSHGFGTSKMANTTQLLMDIWPAKGVGVIAYDFPGHGDSVEDDPPLTVRNCVETLENVETLIAEKYPEAKILYFSSSFGAYITLLYLTYREHRGLKAFLRSTAVNMPEKFQNYLKQEQADFHDNGYTIIDNEYDQGIKVTTELISESADEKNDVFKVYKPGKITVHMIHGENDEVIDFEAAKQFAEQFGVPITQVEGGDHRLSMPGGEDKVVFAAEKLFGIV